MAADSNGPENGAQRASPGRLRAWVEFLAREIGPRPFTAPDRLDMAAERIAGAWTEFGYEVTFQPFPFRGRTYRNVCAAPRADMEGADLLVVGAHYDTVSGSPGADDNASGVAGLVEMARLLAPSPPSGVRFVAFGLEEPPVYRTRKMGSYACARELRRSGARLVGMICLEMVGYFTDRPKSQSFPFFFMDRFYPDTGNFMAFVGNMKSAPFTLALKRAFLEGTDVPAEHINAPWFVIGVDFSDHWSFHRFGYPAVMVTDTAFYRNPHYHRPTDTPATLDYDRMARVVDGLAHAVRVLGGRSMARKRR